ncbi:uncharacterized protein V2V93DRAFT_372668 [Kockiozyma suomiensis]|uniref:uncharacterized protein n=1 Tax=Kockiozyma suomiensis TaxID=1337062 RepID=UPI003343FAA8
MAYPSPLCAVPRVLNSSLSILSCPFRRAGLFEIGGRATFVNLDSSTLAVIAPVPFDNESETLIDGKQVKYLIAPDFEHHMALKGWKDKYPDAIVIGPAGLRARKATQGVHVDYEITESNKELTAKDFGVDDPLLDTAFKFVFFERSQNKEIAILHVATKTFIEADILFNLPAVEQYSKSNVSTNGFFSRIFNTMHPDSVWHKRLTGQAFSKSTTEGVKTVAGWDFESIIPCHGEVIDKDAKKAFTTLYADFLKE